MSSEESETASPKRTIFNKLADQIPALGMPHLVAVQNMKATLDAANARTRDSHKIQQEQYKAALEDRAPDFTNIDASEEDMAGDIMVAGDTTTTNHNYYTAATQQPAEAGNGASSLARTLLPLALALGTGAGGLWLYENLGKLQWPGVPDTEYEVRFYDADGNLIEVPRYNPSSTTTEGSTVQ